MTFRLAGPGDAPIGLAADRHAYDYWGRAQWPKGKRARSFSEQKAALAAGLWVWEGEGEPDSIPSDHFPLETLGPIERVEALHDRLRFLREEPLLPDNFPDIIWSAAAHIQALCASDAQRCLAYILMSSRPSNALLNCLHAAFLCELAGARLGWGQRQRQEVVCAALTMNWAIIDLQDALSHQGKGPTASERLAIMSHPAAVERLLRASGVESALWLACCKQHHEEPDGKGYPDKLVASEVAPEASLLRCADRYVAMVASRAHRFGLPSPDAIAQLYEQSRSFDPAVVDAISFAAGSIAPGSLARLADGSLARVAGQRDGELALILRDGSLVRLPAGHAAVQSPSLEAACAAQLDAIRRLDF